MMKKIAKQKVMLAFQNLPLGSFPFQFQGPAVLLSVC